jgi:hypothetical protein
MKHFVLTFVCSMIAFAATAVHVSGQPAPRETASSGLGSAFAGERLTYEAKFNKILRGIPIAEMTMTAESNSGSGTIINAEAVSRGTLLRLTRFSFLQKYSSEMDGEFRIRRTTKHDVQRQRVRDSEAVFDYETNSVVYIETDPKDAMRPPRRIASDIGPTMLDMVAAIYYVRMQPLTVGRSFEIEVSDSGFVYKVPVVVTGREMQKTELGNVMCFKVEPEIFGIGRLIEQKGKMVIWYTDDARRIPVRSTIDAEVGKIDIKLKTASQNGIIFAPRRK